MTNFNKYLLAWLVVHILYYFILVTSFNSIIFYGELALIGAILILATFLVPLFLAKSIYEAIKNKKNERAIIPLLLPILTLIITDFIFLILSGRFLFLSGIQDILIYDILPYEYPSCDEIGEGYSDDSFRDGGEEHEKYWECKEYLKNKIKN